MKIEVFTVHLCVVNAVWSRPFFLDECHRKLSLHPSTVRLFHATPRHAVLCHDGLCYIMRRPTVLRCAALCCIVPRRTGPCRAVQSCAPAPDILRFAEPVLCRDALPGSAWTDRAGSVPTRPLPPPVERIANAPSC